MGKRKRRLLQLDNPVSVAQRAMSDVLARAMASNNDEQILAAAKAVMSIKTEAPPPKARPILDWNLLTIEEANSLEAAIKVHDELLIAVKGRTTKVVKYFIDSLGIWRETPESYEEKRACARLAMRPTPIEPTPEPPVPVLEPGEFIDAEGKHWWRNPDDPSEVLEYSTEDYPDEDNDDES